MTNMNDVYSILRIVNQYSDNTKFVIDHRYGYYAIDQQERKNDVFETTKTIKSGLNTRELYDALSIMESALDALDIDLIRGKR